MVNILPASLQDIHSINKLVNSGYRGEESKKGWTTEADLLGGKRTDETAIERMITKPGAVILKAVNISNELAGCVYLEQKDNSLYLGMLTVSPVLQGAGIGKKLLTAAESFAMEAGLTNITMTVISVRSELIDWYKRNGYQETGKRLPFPMNDPEFGIPKQFLEFIEMKKVLA